MDSTGNNNSNEEEDEYLWGLEKEMESECNVYINKFELIPNKTEDEIMEMSKEEIVVFKDLQITQLKSYIMSLEKEKEDWLADFKMTTDGLIERIKDWEFNNKGVRPQTGMIVNKMNSNNNNNKINNNNKNNTNNTNTNNTGTRQRCPNCTQDFNISEYTEHTLQCLRKMYRCNKCNSTMNICDKAEHIKKYLDPLLLVDSIRQNNEQYFKECIIHDFPINDIIIKEKGETPLFLIVEHNRLNWLKIITKFSWQNLNVNAKNKEDWSPLMLGCKYGFTNIVIEWIKKGGNINEKNILGDTPLKIAQVNNHENLVLLLINQYNAGILKNK